MRILKAIYHKLLKIRIDKTPKCYAKVVQLAPTQLLSGRCALITGGTSGIGYAIADAMLNAGIDSVVITGRNEEKCKDAAERLEEQNENRTGRVHYYALDMTDVSAFEKAFSNIKSLVDGHTIDILCNNAGVQGAYFGKAIEAEYDSVMNTNFKGTYFLSQLIAHYMIENDIKGNILNIGSSSSNRPTNSAYSLSKACIKELTEGMAKYLIPHGIVVNGIAPGPTATPLTGKDSNSSIYHRSNPAGRFALAEEIANMAVVLTSDMGRMVVGSLVYMTGGAGNITYDDVKYEI